MARFWFACSSEEFTPSQMLVQAQAAERAGFDGLGCSDHFAPWWPEGQAAMAWAHLAALGQLTSSPIGTAVTPVVHHYHPGVIAQFFMSLEELYPGRIWLGVGSGEALNEVPLGLTEWPSPKEKLARFDAGLEAIRRLWDGETVTMDGGWFALHEAKLYTRAARRPRLYVSAFGPKAARIAARHGDGLWTLGDPEQAPRVIDAYRAACAEFGHEPGEIIVQAGFHLAEGALEATRKWKATQMDEVYLHDVHGPADMSRMAQERVSDDALTSSWIISADAAEHVERIRGLQALGATVVCLQLVGDADPLGSIRRYGDEVLPALRRR